MSIDRRKETIILGYWYVCHKKENLRKYFGSLWECIMLAVPCFKDIVRMYRAWEF